MLCSNHLDMTPFLLVLTISSPVCRLVSALLSTKQKQDVDVMTHYQVETEH